MTTTPSSCWWWLVLIGFLLKQIYHVCRLIAAASAFSLFTSLFTSRTVGRNLTHRNIVMKRSRVLISILRWGSSLCSTIEGKSRIANRTTPTKPNRTELMRWSFDWQFSAFTIVCCSMVHQFMGKQENTFYIVQLCTLIVLWIFPAKKKSYSISTSSGLNGKKKVYKK